MLIVLTGTNVFTYQTTLNQIFHLFFILFNQTYLIFTLFLFYFTSFHSSKPNTLKFWFVSSVLLIFYFVEDILSI